MLGIGNSNPGEDLNGPEVIGRKELYDGEGNRFLFKYHPPLELHPYYERLIEENKDNLLEEATLEDSSLDVTQRFEEEAQRQYREDSLKAST
ncbi:MAG: hypothetical protein V5A79_02745 [Candidatus Bipolaricaulota bacterium]|nr:hypothetical protein [Candidatus Bipolaricaulota bacterium]